MDILGEGLLVTLVVGIITGWFAGQLVGGTGLGLVGDLVVGIVGAFIASWIFPHRSKILRLWSKSRLQLPPFKCKLRNCPEMLHSPLDTRALWRLLHSYREPNSARSIFELAITAVPFVVIWAVMWMSLHHGYWIGLLLVIPAAGFLVRLFMIQHDCGHGSFFRGRLANDWVGRAISVVTLTPYDLWRRGHAHHHAHSGNLDHRGIGDIDTLTVREFLTLSPWRQLHYRLYRHPIVMFGVGPTYLFIFRHRLPVGMMRSGWEPWLSTMSTNAAITILLTAMIWLVGVKSLLLVHLPITVLAASIGVWLFYIQHQFEDTLWSRNDAWSFHEAALHGSSYYHLPGALRWFTANIGVHHVHHLCSRIPCYRLSDVLRDHPELAAIGRITMLQSLQCVRGALWDEASQRLVSFEEAAQVHDASG